MSRRAGRSACGMTQSERETEWVTEDDESIVLVTERCCKKTEKCEERQPGVWQDWKSIFCRLTRVKMRGNSRPRIGQRCIVMKGKVGEDEGQMAVVTGSRKVMVEIAWKGGAGGLVRRKLKHPQSLVMLEEGLVVEQSSDGTVWIRRARGVDTGRGSE